MDRQGKPRWGGKTPPYSEWMRVLDRCLPEAHFVHPIRDGRELSLPRTARALRAEWR